MRTCFAGMSSHEILFSFMSLDLRYGMGWDERDGDVHYRHEVSSLLLPLLTTNTTNKTTSPFPLLPNLNISIPLSPTPARLCTYFPVSCLDIVIVYINSTSPAFCCTAAHVPCDHRLVYVCLSNLRLLSARHRFILYAGTSFVPITAAVQVLPPTPSPFPFRGPPLSFPELEEHRPDLLSTSCIQSRNYLPYTEISDYSKSSHFQCTGAQEKRHYKDEVHMSQGSATSRPSSNYIQNERSKRLPPLGSRTLPPIQKPTPAESPQTIPNPSATHNLSARPQPQSFTPPNQRSTRPVDVQNLLNPTSGEDITNTQNRRRNGEHLDSPPGAAANLAMPGAPTPSLPAPSMTNRSPMNVSLPSITPPMMSTYPQPIGRVLTPRGSPSTYAPAPITINNPTGTMDAKQSPFVLAQGTGVGEQRGPEIARVPSMPGEPYGSSLPRSRSPPGRQGSQDISSYDRMQVLLARTSGGGTGSHPPASQSDSPSTQYSSYSQLSRTPPAGPQPSISSGQPQSFFTNPFNAAGPSSSMAPMGFDVPASSGATGGSTYQMMTLDTENGPIQVPVDVQAASKVADEKRKRNATASHRFRQRRKEKERETSHNIAKLELQIREMEEEREHYRRERDYFREVAVRSPGQPHLLPRPISPRQRRHASMGGAMGFGNLQFQGSEGGNRNGGRNTRRRTSNYVPPTGPPPQSAEPQPSISQFEQPPQSMSEHPQGGNRGRLQEPLSLKTGPFDPSTQR